jgi:hypothetical protein
MKRGSLIGLIGRCLATFIALPGVAVLAPVRPALGQFSVSPVILPIPASAETVEATVAVRNSGHAPLRLRLFTEDFDQSLDGSHVTFPAGEHGRSCARRMQVFPELLTVPPGVSQPVSIRMAPGSPPEGTCWSMVFIESPPPEGSGLRAGLRIGVKVYGLVEGGRGHGDIVGASVAQPSAPEDRTLVFTVTNAETWPIVARGSVEIRDLAGSSYAIVRVEPLSVLPGHDREVSIPIPGRLDPGRYLAIPVLEFGGEDLMGAQVTFRVE